MNEEYYIVGIQEERRFKTDDGKTLVPVLLVNSNDFEHVASDWASIYMFDSNIDTSCAYVPYFVQQKDGSYKRKFRKVGE